MEKSNQINLVISSWADARERRDVWFKLRLMKRIRHHPVGNEIAPKNPRPLCEVCGSSNTVARSLCRAHYNEFYKSNSFVSTSISVPDLTRPSPISENQQAYIAGYLDSEGCILVSRSRGGWRALITFSQTCPSVVRMLMASYGGSLRYAPSSKKHRRWRGVFKYTLSKADDLLIFLRDVGRFSIEKRDQIDAVWERWSPAMSMKDGNRLKVDLSRMKARCMPP